jgi:hypothetical protein
MKGCQAADAGSFPTDWQRFTAAIEIDHVCLVDFDSLAIRSDVTIRLMIRKTAVSIHHLALRTRRCQP